MPPFDGIYKGVDNCNSMNSSVNGTEIYLVSKKCTVPFTVGKESIDLSVIVPSLFVNTLIFEIVFPLSASS